MRKFLCVILASALILCSACDSSSSSKKNNKKDKDTKEDTIEENETEETTKKPHDTKPTRETSEIDITESEEATETSASETLESSSDTSEEETTTLEESSEVSLTSAIESNNTNGLESYEDILSLAYDYVYTDLLDELDDIQDEYWGLFEYHYYTEADLQYTLADIDGNGVYELIIFNKDSNTIILCYTMNKDTLTPVFLFNGTARQTFYILEFGNIYYEGSSGAAYAIRGNYHIADDGISLASDGFYYTDFANIDADGNMDYDSLSWFYTEDYNNILVPDKSECLGSVEELGYEIFEPGLGYYEFEESFELSSYK